MNRHVLLLTILAAAHLAQANSGWASALCDRLAERLASLPEVIGTSVQARSISNAITRQTFEIHKAERQARERNCETGSVVITGALRDPACDEIASALEEMQANHRQLTAERDAATTAASLSATRRRLQAALSSNDCAAEQPYIDDERPSREPISVFPEGEPFDPADQQSPLASPDVAAPDGPLRTLCVRTCDGAFFPISSHASPMNFADDAQTCARMCPGAETELYYHALLSQESADMRSAVTGRPYSEMPKAFAYRRPDNAAAPACGCNFSAYYQNNTPPSERHAGGTGPGYSSITSVAPTKTAPPDLSIEPRERAFDPARDTARQVGPAFVPTETTSIDLHHPAEDGPQPQQ